MTSLTYLYTSGQILTISKSTVLCFFEYKQNMLVIPEIPHLTITYLNDSKTSDRHSLGKKWRSSLIRVYTFIPSASFGLGTVACLEACPLDMQTAQSLIPTSSTFFHGDLTIKKFLRPFPLVRWFKKCSCQLLVKECALSTGNGVVRVTDRVKCVEGP